MGKIIVSFILGMLVTNVIWVFYAPVEILNIAFSAVSIVIGFLSILTVLIIGGSYIILNWDK